MKDQPQKTPAVQPGRTPLGYGAAPTAANNNGLGTLTGGMAAATAQPTQTDPARDPNAGLVGGNLGFQSPAPTQTDPAMDPNVGLQNTFGADHPMKPPVTGATTQPTPAPTDMSGQPGYTQGALPAWNAGMLASGGTSVPTPGSAAPAAPASPFAPNQPRTTDIAGAPPGGAGGTPSGNQTIGNQWGSLTSQLDLSKLPQMVGGDALRGMTGDAQDAAYRSASGYLDPQWKNDQSALESKLANQGVMQNSEAWNKAMDDFNRQKTFAYGQARDAAFNQGLSAQNQLFSQGLQSNQNSYGQMLGNANLGNSAQGQLAGQGLTAAQTAAQLQAAQAAANAQVTSASTAANASMGNIQAQLAAQRDQNQYQNSLETRRQQLSELLLQQQNPINVANSLNQGTNVTSPQFPQTPNANVGNTDIASLINQMYQGQLTGYNAQTGASNSNNASMAAIIAAMICDRRFKTNVRKIGMHVAGFPIYEFDYLWGEHGVGPMADEVRQVLPHAVIDLGGFDAVNMALLEAA